jgi:hypothetical protein
MKRSMGLTGEAAAHKVAGIFRDPQRMRECREALAASLEQPDVEIETLAPGKESPAWLLEPESRGIWHTLVRAHLWLGVAGAAAGLLAFALLSILGVAFVVQNPWASAVLLLCFGAAGGALIGGLVTVRPDHTPYIARVRAALDDGRYVLVAHPHDREQASTARECLGRHADDTVTTL